MMALYARLWGVPLAHTVGAIAAVVIGLALGVLTLLICYHPQNVMAVANPVEHLFAFTHVWAAKPDGDLKIMSGALLSSLVEGLRVSLANHSFVFWPTHRPTLLLEWLAIAGLVVCLYKREGLLAAKVGVLIVAAWVLDAIFWLRGLKSEYFAYTDPFLIIAAALIAARFADLQSAKWTKPISIGMFAFYMGWAHADPIRMSLTHKHPEQDDCYWLPHYLPRIDRFPFCPAPLEQLAPHHR